MKKVIILISVLVCIVVAFLVFLYAGRAGGEIGFVATINRVEDGIAYATVTDDDTGFGAKKLPESIMFEVADLDIELQAGDIIRGCYLRGTIDGQTVRVVSVVVKTEEPTLLHETESEDSNIEITDLTVHIDESFSVSESVVVCEIAADGEFATIYSDLQSIYSVAANVVVGTVTEIQYTDDTAIPRTVYSFYVSETLKGTIHPNSLISISESNGYVRVSTFIEVYGQAIFDELYDGGVFGGFTDMQVTDGVILQSLYGAPLAEVGDQYILFLGKQKTEGRIKGTYVPMGNFMGKYVLDTNTNLYTRFFPLENPYFYAIEDSTTGNILIEQPMSLLEIKDSITDMD